MAIEWNDARTFRELVSNILMPVTGQGRNFYYTIKNKVSEIITNLEILEDRGVIEKGTIASGEIRLSISGYSFGLYFPDNKGNFTDKPRKIRYDMAKAIGLLKENLGIRTFRKYRT